MEKTVISYQEYQHRVSKICRSIVQSKWAPDYVVGITRGGLLPAVMISHWLDVKMNSLDISLRDGGDTVSNLGMSDDAFNGANILVVDDINDTGSTINWLIKDWQDGCYPDSSHWQDVWNCNVKFAVIVDNLSSDCEVKMDYSGMEINKMEDPRWIEFPYEEWWTK